jgi:phosphatidylethanolamine-binding protein (PEBP) family uncharacterized protein
MKRQLSFGLALCFGAALGCGDDTGSNNPPVDGGNDGGGGSNSSSSATGTRSGTSNTSGSNSTGSSSTADSGTVDDTADSGTLDAASDGSIWSGDASTDGGDGGAFTLTSPNFDDGTALPYQYTCEDKPFGEGISPELDWSGVPAGTKRLALVFKDTTIEAAGGPNQFRAYHWVAWDIPTSVGGIPQHLSSGDEPDELGGGKQFRAGPPHDNEFFGPCPSWAAFACPGEPRANDSYAFVLYAFAEDDLDYPEGDAQALHDFLEQNAFAVTTLTATSDAQPTTSPAPCPFTDAGADAGDAADTTPADAGSDASADASDGG